MSRNARGSAVRSGGLGDAIRDGRDVASAFDIGEIEVAPVTPVRTGCEKQRKEVEGEQAGLHRRDASSAAAIRLSAQDRHR